jgi:hypothetical protein
MLGDDFPGMLDPQIPTVDFEISNCEKVLHENVFHAIPKDDSKEHSITGCKCGFVEVKIGETVVAVVHKAWDKRDLLEMLYHVESPEEAHEIRKEYMEEIDNSFRKGKITGKERFNKWFLFEDTCETIFRSN